MLRKTVSAERAAEISGIARRPDRLGRLAVISTPRPALLHCMAVSTICEDLVDHRLDGFHLPAGNTKELGHSVQGGVRRRDQDSASRHDTTVPMRGPQCQRIGFGTPFARHVRKSVAIAGVGRREGGAAGDRGPVLNGSATERLRKPRLSGRRTRQAVPA